MSADLFDADCYAERYPDLKAAGLTADYLKEKRRFSATFTINDWMVELPRFDWARRVRSGFTGSDRRNQKHR
jgi:hypothetical protein